MTIFSSSILPQACSILWITEPSWLLHSQPWVCLITLMSTSLPPQIWRTFSFWKVWHFWLPHWKPCRNYTNFLLLLLWDQHFGSYCCLNSTTLKTYRQASKSYQKNQREKKKKRTRAISQHQYSVGKFSGYALFRHSCTQFTSHSDALRSRLCQSILMT